MGRSYLAFWQNFVWSFYLGKDAWARETIHGKIVAYRSEPANRNDMKVADIKKMRDRAPFRPFQLHLTNGELMPVRHPEYVAMPPEGGTELFVVWLGSNWNLVDATQVARLSLLNGGRKSRAA
jgi:hypothetical protein